MTSMTDACRSSDVHLGGFGIANLHAGYLPQQLHSLNTVTRARHFSNTTAIPIGK